MQLDRSHLELLAALQTHDTLGAAASAINLSGSAASRRLREAERRVGVTIARVEGRRVTLTPAGRYLAAEALRITQRVDQAMQAASWLDSGRIRPVYLGIGFHDQVASLLDRTGPPVSIRQIATDNVFKLLRSGQVDLALDVKSEVELKEHDPEPGDIDRTDLATDRLVAVVAHDHALASRSTPAEAVDFATEPYLSSGLIPKPGFEFETVFHPGGFTPNLVLPIDSEALVMGLVEAGFGISIQPSLSVTLGRRVAAVAAVDLNTTATVVWTAYTRVDPEQSTSTVRDGIKQRFDELAS